MPRNKDIKVKNTNLNVKFPEQDYMELQVIADKIGGITLSSMVRIIIYSQLEKVKKSGDERSFLTIPRYEGGKIKSKIMNVKLPKDDYIKLQTIADDIGVTLSLMIRMLIYSQLEKVRTTGEPREFLNFKSEEVKK